MEERECIEFDDWVYRADRGVIGLLLHAACFMELSPMQCRCGVGATAIAAWVCIREVGA